MVAVAWGSHALQSARRGVSVAELLRVVANVATPLALLGVGAVLAAAAYRHWLKSRHKQLAQLPEQERAQAVDQMLTRYKISGADLTKEQRFHLINKEMDRKEEKAK